MMINLDSAPNFRDQPRIMKIRDMVVNFLSKLPEDGSLKEPKINEIINAELHNESKMSGNPRIHRDHVKYLESKGGLQEILDNLVAEKILGVKIINKGTEDKERFYFYNGAKIINFPVKK